jgi:hypothetical protein
MTRHQLSDAACFPLAWLVVTLANAWLDRHRTPVAGVHRPL